MQRKTPHFSQTQNRPDPDFSDRPANKAQQAAAEEYARVGLERAFKKSQLEAHQAESGATPLVSKEQLAEYHAAWQDYWNKYYQQYYSEYYNKYHGQVQEVVQTQHRRSYNKIVEMFNDNKKLAEEKKRLEDPEGIRRDLINRVVERGRKSRFWYRVRHHVKGLIFAGFATGIFLFVQFNPVVVGAIKQYLGPSAASSFPSIIDPSSTTEVSKTPTLIIPKIGISVPIVLDERSAENEPVQKALEHGVIRYWKSSDPGQTGNVVILGHSSNNLLSRVITNMLL
jgi:hypothetical protein